MKSPTSTSSKGESREALRSRTHLLPSERMLGAGATMATLGLGLCLVPVPDLGGLLCTCGLAVLLVGLHRFGRSGRRALDLGRVE